MKQYRGRLLAGIQNRLIIAFLTVATIPVVVVSIYGAHIHLNALERMAFDAAADEANLRAEKLQQALDGAQSDLFYLSQMPSLDAFIAAGSDEPAVDADYAREKLAKQFETFMASRDTYRAVAYFDSRAREVIRVERTGTTASVVPAQPAPRGPDHEELLHRGQRLLAGQTLTQVTGQQGGEATAHFVTRLFPRGLQRRGMVLLEVSLAALWEEEPSPGSDLEIVVSDDAGRPIIGEAAVLPAGLLPTLRDQPHRPIETDRGQILTFVPIYPNRADNTDRWSFVAIESSAVAFQALDRYRRVFTLVLALALAGAGGVSALLARQFTGPLRRLYQAAQEIGHGRFDVDLTDQTGDEIGGLARELRAMADKLKIKHDDMQQQIDAKTAELLQAERLSTIGTMSAAIGHEVNNPLGIISMYSQMLAERIPDDDPQAEKVRTIVREASRMSVLVRGLLQFARPPELHPQPVEVRGLLADAVSEAAGLHGHSQRIEVRTELTEAMPTIEADREQLLQVLRNLLINAFHALPDEGEVVISGGPDGEEGITIRIRDNGQGIAPELLPRLFEPFFTTRRFGTGTGLGLAICREIVERHGGTISVTSSVGEGTEFTIRLPCRAPAGRDDASGEGGNMDHDQGTKGSPT